MTEIVHHSSSHVRHIDSTKRREAKFERAYHQALREQWFANVQRERWFEARRRNPAAAALSPHYPAKTLVGSDQGFLACTRAHESNSAGGYHAVSPGGTYRGAYQFLPSTWDNVARSVGRADLVGVDPAQASSTDQDQLATALYHSQGTAPWGGRC